MEHPHVEGQHHLAITVPTNKFAEAKEWLRTRTPLLGTATDDEFECSPAWNARSVYFSGPDACVLELIIRRDLPNDTAGPFTSGDLLSISEVGVAVADVSSTASALRDAGVHPYGGFAGTDFAPVGDTDGLLILVSPARTWFPTEDRVAELAPMSITATGGHPGTYPLGAGSLTFVPDAAE